MVCVRTTVLFLLFFESIIHHFNFKFHFGTTKKYKRFHLLYIVIGGWAHMNKQQLIDLHCVRLCFQVLDAYDSVVGCVVSDIILDTKSHNPLNIVELSSTMSQANGGDKILIFCDRVKRDEIEIVFYEEEKTMNGPKRVWECVLNHKNCKSLLIHHQFGIKFLTPRYKDPNIRKARQAFIQLRRPSDNECSQPIPFEFVPNDQTTKSTYETAVVVRVCRFPSM